jgi:septum formation protein
MRKLLLASESPRRRELVGLLGREVECISVAIPEPMGKNEFPEETVMALSFEKARTAAESGEWDHHLIIGSDTIVYLDGEKLGKPLDAEDAHQMLMRLSGKRHQVYTGLALICPELNLKIVDYSATDVEMGSFNSERAWQYVNSGEVFGKAGAYGIQGHGATLVKAVYGDFFTVVGLPVYLLSQLLERHSL